MRKRVIVLIAVIAFAVIASICVIKNVGKQQIAYKIATVDVYRYVKYREEDKYGIIDRSGNVILEAKYDNIEIPNPAKDVFICYEGEKSIVLNSKNETIFTKYNKVEPIKLKNIASTLSYEKSVLKYEKDGQYGLIDFNGEQVTKPIYTSIENLQSTEGKLLIKSKEKYGVININGTKLVEPKYDGIETDNYYNEDSKYVDAGFIVFNTTNEGYRYGYISYDGRNILNTEYNEIIRVVEQKDIYLIAAKNGKYGFFKESKQLIKPEYQSISYTDNGAIIVERNKQFGIANLKGEIKIEPKYTQIEENGIYLYAQNTSENDVYDIEGNKVDTNFNKSIYETGNKNYRITTILNNEVTYYGIENKEGTELVNSTYQYIEYIYGDYFIAENQKEKYGVINANGDIIIKFNYDLIQKLKNKNVIQLLSKKSKDTQLYSTTLKPVVTMKNANIENGKNYLRIYNKKEQVFLDNEGNKLDENSEIIKSDLEKQLPDKIANYSKVQYSLDDVYYE